MSLVLPATPTTQSDTLKIYFVLNEWVLRRDYRNNGQTIDDFAARVRERFVGVPSDSLRLDIYAGASPEGPAEWNRRLGERRGNALKQELVRVLGKRVGQYNIVNEAARWEGFTERIAQTDEPWRDEVLSILRLPLNNKEVWLLSEREQQLRRLHGGRVWQELLERYLPDFRSSGTAVLSVVGQQVVLAQAQAAPLPLDTPAEPFTAEPQPLPIGTPWPPAWAVKTNLLFWGIVAPNVQIEVPLGHTNRWSIEAEYDHPWWIWNHNANAEQCMNLSLELRLWLGNRWWHPWLDGHHVGLAFGAGYYDFEYRKHRGYQGEYINAYVNYGYQHRFSKHWAMDFGLGLGYIPTKYRYYEADQGDRHLIWQHNGRFRWLGPTHANLSLVYTFNLKHNALSITQPHRNRSRRVIP